MTASLMATRSTAPAIEPAKTVQPSALRLDPAAGESLESWLTRFAHHLFASRQSLFEHFQLTADEAKESRTWGDYLPERAAEKISTVSGISVASLRHMTLARHDGRVVQFDENHRIRRLRWWARADGTRYCPDCLKENRGAYKLDWRLSWSFACTTHRCLLRDACPSCQEPAKSREGRNRYLLAPGSCTTRVPANVDKICGFDLSTTEAEYLPEGHPILRTQSLLDDVIGVMPNAEVTGVLGDLRSTGKGIIAAKLSDDLEDNSGLERAILRGLEPTEERIGATAPKDALYMAAMTTWALRLIAAPYAEVHQDLRRVILSYREGDNPTNNSNGLGSPLELIERWGDCSRELRHRMLCSLDRDFKTSDRLALGTAVHRQTDQQPRRETLDENEVPVVLWPEWTAAVDFGGHYNLDAFRVAMSVGTKLANNDKLLTRPGPSFVRDRPWRTMRPEFFGNEAQTRGVLTTLTLLNDLLRQHPSAIDYARRRRIASDSRFMHPEHWRRISEHVGINPGGGTRALMAYRYAYMRFVGTNDVDIPREWMRGSRRDDAALYTAFTLSITAPLAEEIDNYLSSWLAHSGVNEPVTWSPPISEVESASFPGRPLDDIDTALLHESISLGVSTLGSLAKKVNRSIRHVRLAIERYPLPAPGPTRPLDWTQALGRVPSAASNQTSANWNE
ncbi:MULTISPECIES: TniQ family protein [unclassified Frondihabitans]|uniref:TniQ family protein n=1 Tax=unclassified Frondihabitans TaxID=2626248 RepID=UPI000F503CF8|nr:MULTISPECIES: TniQ family protein [unclassified Frondihabitans]RPE77795.1 TniQ protein [Frondihabitans sp. PhB153]RPF08074.1 TniQ protein [Frondihabitans sp. PhB161]